MLKWNQKRKRMKLQKEEQRKAKLPKLKISNFDGTVTNWV